MTELKVMQMETDEKALCEQEGNEVCDTEDIGFLKRAVKLDLQKFDTLRDLAFCLPELCFTLKRRYALNKETFPKQMTKGLLKNPKGKIADPLQCRKGSAFFEY